MKLNMDNIPQNAGVYIMKDKYEKIIYIGKAKNLKNRVSSYFTGAHNRKTMELVKKIAKIETFICNSEIEAFILENNLIKQYKPKYNILLKDQKTYPYIKITKEEIPRISISRKIDKHSYFFGPFPNVKMKLVLQDIIKVFKIRDCKINVYKDNKKVCLKYYMNLCNGPCVYKNTEVFEEYKENVKNLLDFLENKNIDIIEKMNKKMQEYSINEEFEKAILEREKIKSFMKLLEYQVTESTREQDEDIFCFEKQSNIVFLCILSVRKGKLLYKETKLFENIVEDDGILERLIVSYYENVVVPKKIIMDSKYEYKKDMIISWFKKEKNKKVNILFPKKKGRAYDLLKLTNLNLINEK